MNEDAAGTQAQQDRDLVARDSHSLQRAEEILRVRARGQLARAEEERKRAEGAWEEEEQRREEEARQIRAEEEKKKEIEVRRAREEEGRKRAAQVRHVKKVAVMIEKAPIKKEKGRKKKQQEPLILPTSVGQAKYKWLQVDVAGIVAYASASCALNEIYLLHLNALETPNFSRSVVVAAGVVIASVELVVFGATDHHISTIFKFAFLIFPLLLEVVDDGFFYKCLSTTNPATYVLVCTQALVFTFGRSVFWQEQKDMPQASSWKEKGRAIIRQTQVAGAGFITVYAVQVTVCALREVYHFCFDAPDYGEYFNQHISQTDVLMGGLPVALNIGWR